MSHVLAIDPLRNATPPDLRAGLLNEGQREIPFRYLYDALGSALFEAITLLPEYGLTRADLRLLQQHAVEILESAGRPTTIVELGSGAATKTRWLLQAATAYPNASPGLRPGRASSRAGNGRGARRASARYFPVDISPAALARCRQELSGLSSLLVEEVEDEHLPGLRRAITQRRDGETVLVLFLGSSIGNFSHDAAESFLTAVRSMLMPGDALLLGADLVKSVPRMLRGYDDAAGVTAAFNRNALGHLNREHGSDFIPENYRHQARWNAGERCIEMHLVASGKQTVTFPGGLSFTIEAGESIRTEQSHKYRLDDLASLAQATGFRADSRWVDVEWPFVEDLWVAEG